MSTSVLSLDRQHAERLTLRISLKLDTMAEAHESVISLIREAVETEAWRTFGYNGVSAWALDRFNGALTRLGIEMFAVCSKNESKSDTPSRRAAREALLSERFETESKKYLRLLRKNAPKATLVLSVDLIGQAVSVEVDAADVKAY